MHIVYKCIVWQGFSSLFYIRSEKVGDLVDEIVAV